MSEACCEHDELLHEDMSEHTCLVCLGFTDEGGQLTPDGWARIRVALQ